MERETSIPTQSSSANPKPSLFLQIDTEPLEAQIDRLNQSLLSFLKNDKLDHFDTSSLNACSEYLITEDDFLEKPEKPSALIERPLMNLEDFRSHEFRSIHRARQSIWLNCKLNDLYTLKAEILKSIEIIEKNLSDTLKLRVGEFELNLKVCNECLIVSKKKVAKGMKCKEEAEVESNAYLRQLENEIEELSYNSFHGDRAKFIENTMFEAFNESFPLESNKIKAECTGCRVSATQVALEVEHRAMKRLNQSRLMFVQELNWETTQAKLLKSNYEEKLQELQEKEVKMMSSIKEIQLELCKKARAIELETSKLKELSQKSEKFSSKIKEVLLSIKSDLSELKPELSPQVPLQISIPPLCPTPKHSTDISEIDRVQQEISALESELQNSNDSGAVTFKLNHLRTHLSTLKSSRVLNTPRRHSSFGQGLNAFPATPKAFTPHKLEPPSKCNIPSTPRVHNRANTFFANNSMQYPIESLIENAPNIQKNHIDNRNGNIFGNTPRNHLGITPRNLFSGTPKSFEEKIAGNSVRNECESVSNELAKDENLAKMLEMKEVRLRKMEEELMKKEMSLHNTLIKLPNADEVIPFVQGEMLRYKEKSQYLEKCQKDIDVMVRENLQTKKNIARIEEKTLTLQKKLEESVKKAEKIDEIVSRLEEIEAF